MISRWRCTALALTLSCVQGNDVIVKTSPIDDRAPTDTGDDYDFQHVSFDGHGQQKPGFFAVHDSSGWHAVFTPTPEGALPPVPSDIDLKARMLFIATSKTPGAKSIEVQKITRTFDGLHIYVLETLVRDGCPPGAVHGPPMDIVSLDNVQLDMHVTYDRVHADSCGPPPDIEVACRVKGAGGTAGADVAATPGDTIECDSSQSRAQVGTLTGRRWQLSGVPPGSVTKLTIGKTDVGVTFPVDAWGAYQVELEAADGNREGSGGATIKVLPPEAGVQLYVASGSTAAPRVELHVLELPWGLGSSGDCNGQSTRSWCDVRTHGGLQMGALSPVENKRYRVVVKYLDARLPGAPTACVRAFAGKGVLPSNLCDGQDVQRSKGALWDLGALDLAHAAFYDARLSKPPPPATTTTASVAATTMAVPPPPPPPPPPPTTPPPPPPPPTAAATQQIEL